ncbi:MAG: methyl-accepting chemotaxis protein [Terriglobales bacterium]
MRTMSLKAKLSAGFGIILLIVAVQGTFSYTTAAKMAEISHQTDERVVKMEQSYRIETAIEKQSTGVRQFLLAGKEEALVHDEEGKKEYQTWVQQLQASEPADEGRRLLTEISRHYDTYRTVMDHEIQLRRANQSKESASLAFSPQTSALRKDLVAAVDDFAQFQKRQKDAALQQQKSLENTAKFLPPTLALAGLILGTSVALLLPRSLSRRVDAMLAMIHEIATHNLGVPDMEIPAEDEMGRAGCALNHMKNNLREMIQSIAQTAERVASASEEISASASQQANGADTQKDMATQVATAMQEMSATVAQVSENSSRAAEASRQAAETARQGGTIVTDTLVKMRAIADGVRATADKMDELGKASDQIGRIVGVIDDIADQTNLLALNAAIEAARAGEQGRGFAVVADEVRKLAERTTGATKEIAQMIKSIQSEAGFAVKAMEAGTEQVEEGVKSTAQAGESLKEIIRMAEQVGEMITYIATAATEQSSASEQVNQNMDQISRLVKESALGSQEAAKACQELSGLALDLQKLVSSFQLGKSSPHRGPGHEEAEHAAKPARTMAASAP